MTTVLGAMMGRALGTQVAHIEAGLRSFDLRHPFPEELNRRLASRLAHVTMRPARGRRRISAARRRRHRLEHDPGQPRARHRGSTRRSRQCHRSRSASSRSTASSCSPTDACLRDDSAARRAAAVARRSSSSTIRLRLRRSSASASGRSSTGAVRRVAAAAFFEFVRLERLAARSSSRTAGEARRSASTSTSVPRTRATERREGLGENVVLSRHDANVALAFLRDPSSFKGENPCHWLRPQS